MALGRSRIRNLLDFLLLGAIAEVQKRPLRCQCVGDSSGARNSMMVLSFCCCPEPEILGSPGQFVANSEIFVNEPL